MNLIELIRQLKEEKKRLDRTIASLEAIWQLENPTASDAAAPAKRKGRKDMPEAERLEVSRRMKEYWAAWRKQRSSQQAEGGGQGQANPKGRTGAASA